MIARIVAGLLVCAAAGACVAAVRRVAQRAFVAARSSAKISLLVSLAAAPVMLATAVVGAFFPNAGESKATTLARGIADSMNIGSLHVPVLVTSFVVWAIARRKISAHRPAVSARS